MSTSFASEYQPLLENSEARERAARTRRKKRALIIAGLAAVGVVMVVAITVPLVTGSKQAANGGVNTLEQAYLFETDWSPDTCVRPPVPVSYNSSALSGMWYEIAKIQTPNAAIYQEGCSCTSMTLQLAAAGSQQSLMFTQCNDARQAGLACGAVSVMEEHATRGAWTQTLYGEPTAWHVLLQHDSTLLTYDCARSYDNEIQYGVHLYSRNRKLDPRVSSTKFDGLLQLYGAFLNPQRIAPVFVDQSSCRDYDVKESGVTGIEKLGPSDILGLNMDFVLSD